MKNKEIEEIIKSNNNEENDNIINEIYYVRENRLAHISDYDKRRLEEDEIDLKEKYKEFIEALNKIPIEFLNKREDILEKFNDYNEMSVFRNSYFNEKYYKNGLKDGAKLIIEVFK